MNKVNFHYITVLLDMLYGLELEDEEIEEIGLIAWGLIGNKTTRLYSYNAKINSEDNSIKLPCNASSVESITIPCSDWSRVTNYSENGDSRTAFIESYIESSKVFKSPYYNPGKIVKYFQSGDTLYFPENYGNVNILYKGIVMDNDGLPELSDKEANAIATYIAYVNKYKEGLKTNNAGLIQLAKDLENKWFKQCDQARVTNLSLNDMNDILDVKNSWDRKSYGIGVSPIK